MNDSVHTSTIPLLRTYSKVVYGGRQSYTYYRLKSCVASNNSGFASAFSLAANDIFIGNQLINIIAEQENEQSIANAINNKTFFQVDRREIICYCDRIKPVFFISIVSATLSMFDISKSVRPHAPNYTNAALHALKLHRCKQMAA